MKKFKLAISIALISMTMGITSCGDDSNSEPQIEPVTKGKKITKITKNYNGSNVLITSLAYNNDNKLASFIGEYDYVGSKYYEYNQIIEYNNNTVIITGSADSDDGKWIYTLNKNGYADKCVFISSQNDTTTTLFSYQNGYLNGFTESKYCESCQKEEIDIYNISLSSGNIINGQCNYEEYAFEYANDYDNKSGIMNVLVEDMLWNHACAYYAGILGKPYTKLPSKCINEYEDFVYDCMYFFDEDGYVNNYSYYVNDYKYGTVSFEYK